MNIAINRYEAPSNSESKILKPIDNVLKQTCIELAKDFDGFYLEEVEAFEYKSRSGFSPHSWNLGGYQTYIYESIWDGCSYNSVINKEVNWLFELCEKYAKEEFKTDFDPNISEHADFEQEFLEENHIVVQPQVMFHGYSEGKYSATFSLIVRVSDAPYFRKADWYCDVKVSFKNATELKKKLKKHKVTDLLFKELVHAKENKEYEF